MTTLRIGHANVLSKARGVRHLASQGLDAFGTCETNGLEGLTVDGYTPFFGGVGHPDRRAGDTCVWRRNDHTHLGVFGLRIAKPSEPARIAGLPRFASCQILGGTGLGLPLAVWELHPHYIGEANDRPEVDRVKKVAAGMEDLMIALDGFENMGIANVVLGDFNVPRKTSTEGWESPWEVMESLGFNLFDYGLDGGGVSPKLRIVTVDKVPMARLRSDHDGCVVEVEEA